MIPIFEEQELTLEDLCILLRCKYNKVIHHINHPKYHEFVIPKKKGGSRIILAPQHELKAIQIQINELLQEVYYNVKPNCVHGFVRKSVTQEVAHNIVSNAKPHIGKRFVMNIDLKDYFPSIRASQVKDLFQGEYFLFSEEVAVALALLCTYKKHLPVGSPASPVLANFITIALDKELEKLCSEHDIVYTRYADDLTFSSDEYFDEEIISAIKETIQEHKFTSNEKKFHIQSAMRQQKVTGLVVNKKANVDRRYIRKIRAILHHIDLYGIEAAAQKHLHLTFKPKEIEVERFMNKLKGKIDFIGMVRGREDSIYRKMVLKYNNGIFTT